MPRTSNRQTRLTYAIPLPHPGRGIFVSPRAAITAKWLRRHPNPSGLAAPSAVTSSILIAGREMTIAGCEIIVARCEMTISRHETIFNVMGCGFIVMGCGFMGMSFAVGSTGSGFIVMGSGLAPAATHLYPAAAKRGAVCLSA